MRLRMGYEMSETLNAPYMPDLTPVHGVRRGPMLVIGVALVAMLAGFVGRYEPWSSHLWVKAGSNADVALHGAPPPVEPLILKQVTLDFARKTNAATPFTDNPVLSAAPFIFVGGSNDLERAVDCLASTIYYEAGNETVEGQMAVVQVVLNRARHPAYPRSICNVVFQGHERRTGCQFSYTCDGSMARRRPDLTTWERFRALSRSMVNGLVYAPVGTATHYHTDWVLPYWSAKLDKVRAEGTHLFFRWTGFWGTPKAFRTRSEGGEPSFTKMALLSPAHRQNGNGLDGIDLTQDLAKDLGLSMGLDGAFLGSNMVSGMISGITPVAQSDTPIPAAAPLRSDEKGQFILQVSGMADAASLPELAEQTCGTLPYCKVLAWTDPAQTPKALPATDTQLSSIAFSFLRDKTRDFEKPLWNCTIFPRAEKKQCMRGRGSAARAPAKKSEPAIGAPGALP
jgi:Cell Wall Hydrolase